MRCAPLTCDDPRVQPTSDFTPPLSRRERRAQTRRRIITVALVLFVLVDVVLIYRAMTN